ncbi:2-amino-thiazoline-4-carboxylic acid hydrolase [Georgenia yuyongxinii]|uniref:2-amino-thiazoline-4-carboxylic acid hydrolase n=1 Tax=Georgenia yuyongxinii TaxID=2589797 RepID=A0A5B8C2G9_9MICO|nr:L-2-amino-thiazoline-4-carboxylic acid hydrolase [Georgenia yuyongxinii]QDC23405.1 2-amino-thiazoline-4-carboxylic acid hydrolase [Georgenia yuyongxinii]
MTLPTQQAGPEDADDEIGILQRRRIEANIIAPIYTILKRELGQERAAGIIEEAITEDARKSGARFAAREPGGANLRTFIDIQDLWKKDDALTTQTNVESDDVYSYDVHRCAYAEMYQSMGLAEIGYLLSCVRDFEFIHGYDPDVELTRTQTVMEGASHCDFRYVRRGAVRTGSTAGTA